MNAISPTHPQPTERSIGRLSRACIDTLTVEMLRQGRGWGGDLRLLRVNGRLVVMKDFGHRPVLVRLLGRFLISREAAAYERLRGERGVPRFWGRFGAYALLYEYVPGRLGNEFSRGELSPRFFQKLSDLVDRLHARGVAHGDLKRRTNILVGPDEEPVLIDFAAAIVDGSPWNPFGRWLFRQICQVDRNGIAKLKQRLAPELVTPEEHHAFHHPTFLERLARRLLGR